MEIFAIILIVLGVFFLFKLLSVGLYILTIPIKIVLVILSVLLSVFILIPLGIASGLLAMIVAPFALLIPLLPFILVVAGIVLLVKRT